MLTMVAAFIGLNESRLDECVNALVVGRGASARSGTAFAVDRWNPPRTSATGRNARDTSPPFSPPRAMRSSEPHETMRALGRSGATTTAGAKSGHPRMGTAGRRKVGTRG